MRVFYEPLKAAAGGFWPVVRYLLRFFCLARNEKNEKIWGEHAYPRIRVCLEVFPIGTPYTVTILERLV